MLLKDVAEIIFSFPEKGQADDVKWIYAACLQEDNKIIELKTECELSPSPEYKVQKGDIVVKRIQPQFVNYIAEDIDAYIAQNLVIVRSNGAVNPKYLAYILEMSLGKLYKDMTGSVLTAINRKGFEELDIGELPPAQTQIAIGELWWLTKEKKKLYEALLEKEKQLLQYRLNINTRIK